MPSAAHTIREEILIARQQLVQLLSNEQLNDTALLDHFTLGRGVQPEQLLRPTPAGPVLDYAALFGVAAEHSSNRIGLLRTVVNHALAHGYTTPADITREFQPLQLLPEMRAGRAYWSPEQARACNNGDFRRFSLLHPLPPEAQHTGAAIPVRQWLSRRSDEGAGFLHYLSEQKQFPNTHLAKLFRCVRPQGAGWHLDLERLSGLDAQVPTEQIAATLDYAIEQGWAERHAITEYFSDRVYFRVDFDAQGHTQLQRSPTLAAGFHTAAHYPSSSSGHPLHSPGADSGSDFVPDDIRREIAYRFAPFERRPSGPVTTISGKDLSPDEHARYIGMLSPQPVTERGGRKT